MKEFPPEVVTYIKKYQGTERKSLHPDVGKGIKQFGIVLDDLGRISLERNNDGVYINAGCGFDYREGWLNVDNNPQCEPDIVADITYINKLVSKQTVEGIICIHTLQVLALHDALKFINNCLKILKPNGMLLLQIPDLTKLVEVLHENPNNLNILYDSLTGLIGLDTYLEGWEIKDYYMARFCWPANYLCAVLEYFGYCNVFGIDLMPENAEPFSTGWRDALIIGQRPIGEIQFKKTNHFISDKDKRVRLQEEEDNND